MLTQQSLLLRNILWGSLTACFFPVREPVFHVFFQMEGGTLLIHFQTCFCALPYGDFRAVEGSLFRWPGDVLWIWVGVGEGVREL